MTLLLSKQFEANRSRHSRRHVTITLIDAEMRRPNPTLINPSHKPLLGEAAHDTE